MTATNHALTGALIGLAVHSPWVALPAAILSHFICDAVPHFGMAINTIGKPWFRLFLFLEASLCGLIVLGLIVLHPFHWPFAVAGAFLAASPDFMWINDFRRAQAGHQIQTRQPAILRFHGWIQWFERPIGGFVEATWAVSALLLLKLFIV